MTDTENIDQEETPELPKPRLYSKRAIRVFSILFSTLAGGILVRQNLKDVGNNSWAQRVVVFSILYTVTIIMVAGYFPGRTANGVAFLLNVIGSFILNEYFFEKAVPDSDTYPTKPVWKPLIIWLVIIIVLVSMIIYGGGLPK